MSGGWSAFGERRIPAHRVHGVAWMLLALAMCGFIAWSLITGNVSPASPLLLPPTLLWAGCGLAIFAGWPGRALWEGLAITALLLLAALALQ